MFEAELAAQRELVANLPLVRVCVQPLAPVKEEGGEEDDDLLPEVDRDDWLPEEDREDVDDEQADEEEAPQTERDQIARAIVQSQAEEPACWIGLDEIGRAHV